MDRTGCQGIYQTQIYWRIQDDGNSPWRIQLGPVRLMCVEVNSVAAGRYCMGTYKPWSYATGSSIIRFRTRDWRNGMFFFFLRMEALQLPWSRTQHRGTDCTPFPNRTVTTTRPIAPRPARFHQAVHRATDCFPVTKERERQLGATG